MKITQLSSATTKTGRGITRTRTYIQHPQLKNSKILISIKINTKSRFHFISISMGTFETWRRAFGAIKDSTIVGLAKVSSDFKNIDIAIVKATNHEEIPPKDIHVRRIIVSTSFAVPRADVGYCIHTLSRRLTKTKNWIVAVKTLMVLHRILREGDPSFREELLIYSIKRKIFQIAEFRDESSQLAWDCSSWIRMYAAFLEERLECLRILGFDIETERLTTAPGIGKGYSRTRLMNIDELLDQLPAMQQLLHRLIVCQPEGATYNNCLIQHALALVLKESMKIFAVINDGIIKLVESFFNLPKDDAVNALNIYKKAGKQAEQLAEFYNLWRNLRVAKNIQIPTLTQPPSSFLATMEEYIKGDSSNGSVSTKKLERQDVVEEHSPREIKEVENKEVVQDQEPELKPLQKIEEEALPLITIDDNDFQGLNETTTKAAELDDSNASRPPLAIVQGGRTSSGRTESVKTSSWELAIVTSPINTNNTNTISHEKPGCGFDKMLLYSLYEDDMAKKQIQNEDGMQNNLFHHRNPPPQQDHFMMSGEVTPLTTVQTVMMQQQYMTNQQPYQQQKCQNQYQQWYQQQQNMLTTYNHQESSNQYLQREMSGLKLNPIGDGMSYPHGNLGLI